MLTLQIWQRSLKNFDKQKNFDRQNFFVDFKLCNMLKFIIEHLDSELFEWSLIEYKHISKIVGKDNLVFTSIQSKFFSLLKNFGEVKKESVSELDFKNICILDINTDKTLTTSDKDNFDCFVFGGILGDNPPQQRTQILLKILKNKKIKFETRNLGKKQMSTDTAVLVVKKILYGKKLNEIDFFDNIEIEINENESVMLPYRFVAENGKPVYSNELVNYLRKKEGF